MLIPKTELMKRGLIPAKYHDRAKVVAVDVDLTVVDSLTPWLKWFNDEYGIDFQLTPGEYDLVPAMLKALNKTGWYNIDKCDPFEFWLKEDLYDNLQPIEGAVEALAYIKSLGFKIVFVSKCEPEHLKSKINFLKRFFPDHDGFVATGDKEFVGYDVMIDDNVDMVNKCLTRNHLAKHFMLTQVSARVFQGVPSYMQHASATGHWDDIKNSLYFAQFAE